MVDDAFIPLDWTEVSVDEMDKRSESLLTEMRKRRTTRHFSSRDVPKHLIESHIMRRNCAKWRPPPTMDLRSDIIARIETKNS